MQRGSLALTTFSVETLSTTESTDFRLTSRPCYSLTLAKTCFSCPDKRSHMKKALFVLIILIGSVVLALHYFRPPISPGSWRLPGTTQPISLT